MSADVLKLDQSGGWERNVYYNPEKHGLTQVAQLEYAGGYEFDTRVVWKDAEGRLWTGRDSGCSCPTPFDGFDELERLFNTELLESEYEAEKLSKPSPKEQADFLAAVRAAFAEAK